MQLAVFIDFDNIEIGVKTTLHQELDLALVLDALRERGEVVAKSAYGDWGRAGSHSRTLTEHAVHMVQRNVTPRGDKNGGDINLVVDALEMAFTRPHINAFAIVGGDSDFMSLVEKLKQFGKRVLVVGGRSFTSGILQRNCHEFIAYENLLSGGRKSKRSGSTGSGSRLSLAEGFKKVQRALKVLNDRGVQPQLGPLKSTLLQLDATFSERDYGTSSFRDFISKLESKHKLTMTRIDQGYLVELTGDASSNGAGSAEENVPDEAEAEPAEATPAKSSDEAMELLRRAVGKLQDLRPGKPTYVRHMAQAMRGVDPDFDEAAYGFRTLTELMHMGEREGIVKMQRDRQGAWRVTPMDGVQDGASDASSEEDGAEKDTDAEAALAEATAAAAAALTADADAEDGDAEEAESAPKAKKKAAPRKKKAATAKKKTAAKKTAKATTKKSTTKKAAKKKATKKAAKKAIEEPAAAE